MKLKRLGILISGSGTNADAIMKACSDGILKGLAEVAVVISNKPEAYGLVRAQKYGIKSLCVDQKSFSDRESFCKKIEEELKKYEVDLVCLAGFLSKLEPCFINTFKGKIINIHPALLPKYGGKGMYGHFVHEAVMQGLERESGATVHWVDEEYDHGGTILQETVAIIPSDNADSLAMKVLEIEHKLYPKAILKVISGKL